MSTKENKPKIGDLVRDKLFIESWLGIVIRKDEERVTIKWLINGIGDAYTGSSLGNYYFPGKEPTLRTGCRTSDLLIV